MGGASPRGYLPRQTCALGMYCSMLRRVYILFSPIELSDKKLPLELTLTILTNQPVWYGGYLPRQTRALGRYYRVWHICMNADV